MMANDFYTQKTSVQRYLRAQKNEKEKKRVKFLAHKKITRTSVWCLQSQAAQTLCFLTKFDATVTPPADNMQCAEKSELWSD